jgi:hypothetical protein
MKHSSCIREQESQPLWWHSTSENKKTCHRDDTVHAPMYFQKNQLKNRNTEESSLYDGTNARGFCGSTLPRNYIPMNMYIYFFCNLDKYYPNCLIYLLPTKLCPWEPVKFWLPMNIGPYKLKWFHCNRLLSKMDTVVDICR